MIREILKPEKNSLTLQLPDDLVGKMIEVIAFSIESSSAAGQNQDAEHKVADFKTRMKNFTFNSGGYRFNREEANDYE